VVEPFDLITLIAFACRGVLYIYTQPRCVCVRSLEVLNVCGCIVINLHANGRPSTLITPRVPQSFGVMKKNCRAPTEGKLMIDEIFYMCVRAGLKCLKRFSHRGVSRQRVSGRCAISFCFPYD